MYEFKHKSSLYCNFKLLLMPLQWIWNTQRHLKIEAMFVIKYILCEYILVFIIIILLGYFSYFVNKHNHIKPRFWILIQVKRKSGKSLYLNNIYILSQCLNVTLIVWRICALKCCNFIYRQVLLTVYAIKYNHWLGNYWYVSLILQWKISQKVIFCSYSVNQSKTFVNNENKMGYSLIDIQFKQFFTVLTMLSLSLFQSWFNLWPHDSLFMCVTV